MKTPGREVPWVQFFKFITIGDAASAYIVGCSLHMLDLMINRRETFDHVERWLKEAEELAPANLTVVLVGNKCDLSHKRSVSLEEGQEFADKHGLIFMESSAKSNQNVEEVMVYP
ncbi:hypothetical protein PR202_gb19233 [Eleusine coracana subsp. coracana]|uniref:Uncharacterized protein n=1 Tax=Eleusine coracana subsp. coracana TaxID=191504 RepID=A0AAV5F7N9_ELECO|nr:hypothetical protein PR202_gb19233 [Eleusine coracana subsp. coracana]